MFQRDTDPEVEAARVRSNVLGTLGLVVAILFAVVIALGRQPAV